MRKLCNAYKHALTDHAKLSSNSGYTRASVVQHLRALTHITSLLELKLDTVTMFEWQRHSPDCKELQEFIDLRAQARQEA